LGTKQKKKRYLLRKRNIATITQSAAKEHPHPGLLNEKLAEDRLIPRRLSYVANSDNVQQFACRRETNSGFC
jgi:hypothetical protein